MENREVTASIPNWKWRFYALVAKPLLDLITDLRNEIAAINRDVAIQEGRIQRLREEILDANTRLEMAQDQEMIDRRAVIDVPKEERQKYFDAIEMI